MAKFLALTSAGDDEEMLFNVEYIEYMHSDSEDGKTIIYLPEEENTGIMVNENIEEIKKMMGAMILA